MVPADNDNAKPGKPGGEMVTLELNPGSGVDVLGDANPPLLVVGWERDFTQTEADGLLALTNSHGTPVVRIVGS